MAYKSMKSIEDWAAENGGVEAVREAFAQRRFGDHPVTRDLVLSFIEREEKRLAAADAADERQRREREVDATEQSATEARRSRYMAAAALIISVLSAIFTGLQWYEIRTERLQPTATKATK